MMTNRMKLRALLRITLAALLLVAIGHAALAVMTDPSDEGTWVATGAQDCPDDLVCTEWELRSGEPNEDPSCCQHANMVGSIVYKACTGGGAHFRH